MKKAIILSVFVFGLLVPFNKLSAQEMIFETPISSLTETVSFGGAQPISKIAVGYGFQFGTDEICSVQFHAGKDGNPTDSLVLGVYNNYDLPIAPERTDLLEQVIKPASQFSDAPGFVTFNLNNCLTQGTRIWFVLSRSNPLSQGNYIISKADQNFGRVYSWEYVTDTNWTSNGIFGGYEDQRDWGIRILGPDNQPTRNPVLIIPGMAGTELYNDGNLIWANVDEMKFNDDQFVLENLELNSSGLPLTSAQGGEVIKKIRDLLLFEVNMFEDLEILLGEEGYTNNQDLFYFPYDWRLNLDTTKDLLNIRIEEIKNQTGADKIDIISHSMGGLVVKGYINTYGSQYVNKLIFAGTPHAGAPKAFKVLSKGDEIGIPWLEEQVIEELSLNMSSIYQLLPNSTYNLLAGSYIFQGSNPFNHSESVDYISQSFNSNLVTNTVNFWNKNLDLMSFGDLDVYNIAGCKSGTQGKYYLSNNNISRVINVSGDQTVPLISADTINISQNKKFYVLNAKHSELPSTNGVRELIADILVDRGLDLENNITQDVSSCNIKGKSISFRSPVDVHVYDSENRHSGPIEGGLENNIPGVDYEIIDGHKFIFLPTDENQQYRIEGQGTDNGTFDLVVTDNDNGIENQSIVFNDVAIIQDSQVRLNVSEEIVNDQINFDYDNNGTFEVVGASAILDEDQLDDVVVPITTDSVSGSQGLNGWYKSDILVTLGATDNNSGILETNYSVNDGPFVVYASPVQIALEGVSNLKYYSVDRAGNNEEIKILEIKIDKTAPEFGIKFDTTQKGFVITSTDSFSCATSLCTATDQAGNVSVLKFSKIKVGNIYTLSLKSATYNGQVKDLSENVFVVNLATKNNQITAFTQALVVKKQEIASILYDPKNNRSTIITYKNGQVNKEIVQGIKHLQVKIEKGIIISSY